MWPRRNFSGCLLFLPTVFVVFPTFLLRVVGIFVVGVLRVFGGFAGVMGSCVLLIRGDPSSSILCSKDICGLRMIVRCSIYIALIVLPLLALFRAEGVLLWYLSC